MYANYLDWTQLKIHVTATRNSQNQQSRGSWLCDDHGHGQLSCQRLARDRNREHRHRLHRQPCLQTPKLVLIIHVQRGVTYQQCFRGGKLKRTRSVPLNVRIVW